MNHIVPITLLASTLVLTACGGGGGSSSSPTTSTGGSDTSTGTTSAQAIAAKYEDKLNDTFVDVRGKALLTSNGRLENVNPTARFYGNTGVFDLQEGQTNISGMLNDNGIYVSGRSRVVVGPINELLTDYVSAYNYNRDIYSDASDHSFGVIGIVTETGDMPTSSTATYSGEAFVDYATIGGAQGTAISSDTSVSANFETRQVDVSMDNLNTFIGSVPFGSVEISGMTISGNGFSGGEMTVDGTSPVSDIVGSNATTTADANFYGYDGTIGAPDEVGGTFSAQGSSAVFLGVFIAD